VQRSAVNIGDHEQADATPLRYVAHYEHFAELNIVELLN